MPNIETPTLMIEYPPQLREAIAAAELPSYDGPPIAELMAAARVQMQVPADYQDGPCPMWREHNHNGTQSVWWKVV